MNKQTFDELVKSVKEADNIIKGKSKLGRVFKTIINDKNKK